MIIFLYGQDSYRRQEKLKEIVGDYKKKHSSFSLENFNFENEEEFVKFREFIKSNSLFDDFKLGIIRNSGFLEGAKEKELIDLLKANIKLKESALIISEDKKPAKNFAFLSKKPVLYQEFEKLSADSLKLFLQKEINKRNMILDEESHDLLMQAYEGDTWGLITELDKLLLLDEKKITCKILETHLEASLPLNIFLTINQIRNTSDISRRLFLLEELLFRSNDPAMIFNILAVSSYMDSEWKRRTADYDVAVKSGKLEYEEALLDLILR